jgi:metal-sulfur cluster biosynthetic enzyme
MVEDLAVDSEGRVCYTFKPSSPFCPIAVFLAQQVKQAVAEIPDVTAQQITVTGYVATDELTELINKEN